jgi:hypothetical protein
MSSKKINIDPKVFNISSKTRSKRNVPTKIPAISPNILKNKLLKRIKEHKTKEIENEKKQSSTEKFSSDKPQLVEKSLLDVDKYNNEFDDSMSLLQSLSKDKKENDYKQNKKTEINRKTVKHYSNEAPTPYVNLELPEILKEPLIVENSYFNIKPNNAVPYGNLKNGFKPTYREWNKTHRNISQPAILIPNNNNIIVNERENRMKKLREKLRQNPLLEKVEQNAPYPPLPNPSLGKVSAPQEPNPLQESNPLLRKVEQKAPYPPLPNPPLGKVSAPQEPNPLQESNPLLGKVEQKAPNALPLSSLTVSPFTVAPYVDLVPSVDLAPPLEKVDFVPPSGDFAPLLPKVDKVDVKRSIKRTIRKRYTLGKSKIKRSVAILLKDNKTRKNVITAQKELKRQPINDVKQYLRDHNLIKVGSNAPNELIRKTYEYSMLAGDITNNNKDTLLHNFMTTGDA